MPLSRPLDRSRSGRRYGPTAGSQHPGAGWQQRIIVAPSADLEMALPAIVFSAVGTAGQRCTWLRRLIVHEDIYEAFVPHLVKKYEGLPIGDALAEEILVGPLIDFQASTVNYSGKLPLAQGIEFEI